MNERGDKILNVVTVAVWAGLFIWEIWLVLTVWRGGDMPIPFVDWDVDSNPLAAGLLFVFGTPLIGFLGAVLVPIIAGPLVLVFGRSPRVELPTDRNPLCHGTGRELPATDGDDVVCPECGMSVLSVEVVPGKWEVIGHTTSGEPTGGRPMQFEPCPGSDAPAPAGTEKGQRAECPECGHDMYTWGITADSLRIHEHLRPRTPTTE